MVRFCPPKLARRIQQGGDASSEIFRPLVNVAARKVGLSYERISGTVAGLRGRAEQSSPNATQWRAAGAGLDSERRGPSEHPQCRHARDLRSIIREI